VFVSAHAKPLGGKAYGHIPHLPGSRLGSGDHTIEPGQARICTEKARDRHDRIVVQEKLDGSCVSVARVDGAILPLMRAGYLASSSPRRQHQLFAAWVRQNEARFRAVLHDGERLAGEWLLQAHGTRYALPHEPFVVFDLLVGTKRAATAEELRSLVAGVELTTPRLIHDGGAISVEDVVAKLEPSGHGALEGVEGAVWRVERRGVTDFVAKFVRHGKADGKYLECEGVEHPVWNVDPATLGLGASEAA
jgi:hypothetical protein